MSTAPCSTKVSPWAGAHQHGNGGVQGTLDGVLEAGSPVPHGGKPHGHRQPLLRSGSLQASEHRHKLGGAGEQPQTGRAMGPPWPRAHPGGLRQRFGPQHCVPAMLGSCTVTTGPTSTDQHPTQVDAPKSQQPQCHHRNTPSSACGTIREHRVGRSVCLAQPQQQAGSPWALFLGRRMGTDTQSEGLSLLSHRHPPQRGHGLPGPCNCWEGPATGDLGWDGPPSLPGSSHTTEASGAQWAPAVPKGLSTGAEQAASLLHDCVFRAGLCKAVVPSSSLSVVGRWMSPGRTVPSAGCAWHPPAPHRRDPGYLASHSHW